MVDLFNSFIFRCVGEITTVYNWGLQVLLKYRYPTELFSHFINYKLFFNFVLDCVL